MTLPLHLFSRKCPNLRSLTSCSTCWTVWRSSVSMENVCTSRARITLSSWPTSRRRCSSPGEFVFKQTIEERLKETNDLLTYLMWGWSFSLWSMLKSRFCQLASLAVPQLLHALSLSHGADIFWNLINSNFNSKDWKIRFEAGKTKTCCGVITFCMNVCDVWICQMILLSVSSSSF